jgi:ribose transport system substrate-binding protein
MVGILVLFALALIVTGCGGGSSSDSTTTATEASSTEGSSSSYLDGVNAYVDKLLGPKGSFEEFPTSSPVKPDPSRSIAIIDCGEEIGACKLEAEAAETAAQKLGWKTTVFDTKANPATANTGIRNALAEGVDGITMYLTDCQYIKAGLEEAKEAGVPVYAVEGKDCNETSQGSEPLYTAVMRYAEDMSFGEYQTLFGKAAADYAISKADGKSNALAMLEEAPSIKFEQEAFEDAYAECEECELNVVNFPLSAYGTKLQGIAETELLRSPDINAFLPSFEAAALETYPAVQATGRGEEIATFVGEGNEGGLDLIREGTNTFAFNWPVKWEGWGAIDGLGRLFLGQEPVHTGQGAQLIDADHNLSAGGPAEVPVDFEAMYERLWGLK